ncbi:hypothetical protein IKF12_00390 [Candidatus Saccharibacteria bacterium]|nr:hypothetical protein [Candidatus Saccharibacteria bacterium]
MKRLEGVVLLGAITIVGALGISGSSSALEYQTNPSTGDNPVTLKFEFGSTLTINTDGNIAISNLTPGTANVSSSSYRVTVNTNNVAGYTLTATVGCSTGTNCYNNKTLSDGTNTFSMVTSTSGTALTAGEWGFTTSGSATATSSVFKTLALYSDTTPTTLNKTKDATGTAYDNTFAGNTTTPFQIGAYAANNQVAGTYTNVINFSAVANPVPEYTVTLATSNANSIIIDGVSYVDGDTPTLTQGLHSISGTLPTNYGFGGWTSTGSITILNSSSLSTTVNILSAGTLTLAGVEPPLYFQDATSADCGKTMYDNRGTDEYKSTAYSTAEINGLCWMTRNLDLPGGTTLSSADTNVPNNWSTTTVGFVNGNTLPASSTSGFSDGDTAYVYNSGRTVCTNNSADGSCYSHYSYAAATAGTNPSSGDATSDICPRGWRLPTRVEFDALISNFGTNLTASPFLGVYSGFYYESHYNALGGNYLSSTAGGNGAVYSMYIYDGGDSWINYDNKEWGFAVRCVAKS